MSEATKSAAGEVLPVSEADFGSEILQSAEPVLVDFWAPWCGPCRMLAPALQQIAAKYAGKAKVRKLNVDDNPATARRYGIMSIPAVLLFRGGEVVETLVGLQPAASYEAALDRVAG